MFHTLLTPKWPDLVYLQEHEAQRKVQQEKYYNTRHRAVPLQKLTEGTEVHTTHPEPGVIKNATVTPRQYEVETPTGVIKDEDEGNPTQETIPLPDSAIVDSMPKTKRQKAMSILNRLKTRPDIITWDESGRVTLEGVKVPGSNISDLLSDAVKGRKNFNPTGSKRFFNVLSKINMRKDLVRNEERWKQSEIDNSHGEVVDESSQSATPLKYFRSLVERHEAKKPTQTSWLKY